MHTSPKRTGRPPTEAVPIDPCRSKQTWELYMGGSSSRYRSLFAGCRFLLIKDCDRGKMEFELRDPDW